jgi:RNA polymerase sigma factor (sigma-70 family)
MPKSPAARVIDHLRSTVMPPEEGGATDGQLLQCYLNERNDAAFAALVRRHGPMVWGVCRRVVGHEQDAEDAFQATFLVLARKAASVVPRQAVGGWLHGVAYHTALKARAAAAKRRLKERQVEVMPEPQPAARDPWQDLQPLLDQELSRLPVKYRLPVVLCDLEGKARKDVARELEIPEGTLSSRLTTARGLLARRLTRRGLLLSGGALAAVLSANAAPACVPASVMTSTIKAATLLTAGQAAAGTATSANVAALTEGVVRTMFLKKLRTVTAVLLAVGLAFAVGGFGINLFNLTPPAAQAEEDKDPPKTLPARDADRPTTDRERLQGAWEFVSVTLGGKTIKKEELKEEDSRWKSLTFTGDKVRAVNVNTGGKEVEFNYGFKLDPSGQPKTFDLTGPDGGAKDTVPGLYELDGDSLKMCVPTQPGQERPTTLESREGSATYLLIFKRKKDRLLIYRAGHLTLIGPDGKDEKQVSRDRGQFMPGTAWLSPDGQRLAFLLQVEREPKAGRDPRRKLYVRGLDEPEPGTDLGVEAQHVCWSPDGKQLVAADHVHGNDPKDLTFVNWLVDVKTKEKTALKLPNNHCVEDWSRDGKYFLTTAYQLKMKPGTARPYLMNRDGTEAQALTDGSEPVHSGRLSPDGNKLLYLAPDPERKGKAPGAQDGLFVLNISKRKSVRVEQQPLNGDFMGFCWSPDGKRIAYAWRQVHEKDDPKQETASHLVVADANGKNPVTIATEKGDSAGLITISAFDWR